MPVLDLGCSGQEELITNIRCMQNKTDKKNTKDRGRA